MPGRVADAASKPSRFSWASVASLDRLELMRPASAAAPPLPALPGLNRGGDFLAFFGERLVLLLVHGHDCVAERHSAGVGQEDEPVAPDARRAARSLRAAARRARLRLRAEVGRVPGARPLRRRLPR